MKQEEKDIDYASKSLRRVDDLITKESGVVSESTLLDWAIEHKLDSNVFIFRPIELGADVYFIANEDKASCYKTSEDSEVEALEDFAKESKLHSSDEENIERLSHNSAKKDRKKHPSKKVVLFSTLALLLVLSSIFGVFKIFGGEIPQAQSVYSESELKKVCSDFSVENCKIVEINNDSQRGTFIKQSTHAGVHLIKPSEIVLTYSKGPSEVKVPNLSGLTEEKSKEELFLAGLQLGRVLIEDNPDMESGRVIKTKQETDSLVKNGEKIDIIISSDKIFLTDWTGSSKEAIEIEAKEKNIEIKFEEEDSKDIAPGLALKQSHSVETYKEGDVVVITLAKAASSDFIEVPEVIGKTPEMAQSLLVSAGFTNFSIIEVENNVNDISVTHVVPGVKQSVSADSNVVLIVSKPIK